MYTQNKIEEKKMEKRRKFVVIWMIYGKKQEWNNYFEQIKRMYYIKVWNYWILNIKKE